MEVRKSNPGLFTNSEMPLLNFMIFDAEERGELKVRRTPLQLVCESENQKFLIDNFRIDASGPNLSHAMATVLHFTDPKPLACCASFNAPVQYFRKKCANEYLGVPRRLTGVFTRLEEIEWRLRVYYRRNFGGAHARIRRTIKRLFKQEAH
jgi:hypothetical protein